MFGSGKSKSKGPRSRSVRAGVVFPVGRLSRHIKRVSPNHRLGSGAPVYLAAVLEYLSAEVLELAGNSARDNRKKRIRPRDVKLAVENDNELSKLCDGVTFSEGGNKLNILPELINGIDKKKKSPVRKRVKSKVKLRTVSKIPARSSNKAKMLKTKPDHNRLMTVGVASSSSIDESVTKHPVLSTGRMFLGQELTVLMGDISLVTCDAIVHPTNGSYSTSGQVGTVLLTKGGLQYSQRLGDLRSQGQLSTCSVSLCEIDNIPAKKVIHCNSPSWNKSSGIDDLVKTIENCLKLAEKENMKSIALPSVGSGNAGWPKQLAAETILGTINRYFQTIMASSIRQVYFVLFDKESVEIYTTELRNLIGK